MVRRAIPSLGNNTIVNRAFAQGPSAAAVVDFDPQINNGRGVLVRRLAADLPPCSAATTFPNESCSEGIPGVPHLGFSNDIRRINLRISASILGRPRRRGRDFHRQSRRKPSRCHRATMFGSTITSTEHQPGQRRDRHAQITRPRHRTCGLSTPHARLQTVPGGPGSRLPARLVLRTCPQAKRRGCISVSCAPPEPTTFTYS